MNGRQTAIYLLSTDTVIQDSKKFALRGKGNECDRFDVTEDNNPVVRCDDLSCCKD